MKRMTISLLCFFMLLSVPICTEAASPDRFQNGNELYQYWASIDGEPDYLTGVWSSDGSAENLTFGVTNDEAGREGVKHILDLVEDDTTVSFAYQTYTLRYLYTVQEEIEPYLTKELGFMAVGINAYANRVEVTVAQAQMDDEDAVAAIHAIEEKYGAAVFIGFTSCQFVPVGGANGQFDPFPGIIGKQTNVPPFAMYFLIAVSGILLVALFLSEYRRRKLLAFLNNRGTVEVPQPKCSRHAVEQAIHNSAVAPSPDLETRIKNAVANVGKNENQKAE